MYVLYKYRFIYAYISMYKYYGNKPRTQQAIKTSLSNNYSLKFYFKAYLRDVNTY